MGEFFQIHSKGLYKHPNDSRNHPEWLFWSCETCLRHIRNHPITEIFWYCITFSKNFAWKSIKYVFWHIMTLQRQLLPFNRWFFPAPANQNGEVCIKKRLRNLFECILTKSDAWLFDTKWSSLLEYQSPDNQYHTPSQSFSICCICVNCAIVGILPLHQNQQDVIPFWYLSRNLSIKSQCIFLPNHYSCFKPDANLLPRQDASYLEFDVCGRKYQLPTNPLA